jgi:lipoic acid synthetase
LPEWIKTKKNGGLLRNTKKVLRSHQLSTVCEEARCPNAGECFSKPTAAFMILGSICTRNCGFCSVKSSTPGPLDPDEPERIAMAAREMGLKYVVITSVTRDDLDDGGAGQFAKTVRALRERMQDTNVEVLTPDFKGNLRDVDVVLRSEPCVFNHNMETVPRLYSTVRPSASYKRSLNILHHVKKSAPGILTKSGLMMGLGETFAEVLDVLHDLRNAGCESLTVGQYLRPSRLNLPVIEYIEPSIFERLRLTALSLGFKYVASAPLVRSSMNAEEMYNSN